MYFPKYRNFDTGNFSLALSIFRVSCICGNFTFETLNLHVRKSTLEKIVPQGLMRKTEYEVFMIPKLNLLLLFTFYYLKYRNHL